MFNPSFLQLIPYRPWRWTTPPAYNPDGSEAAAGTKGYLQGVFILLSDELIEYLAANLTQAEKDELRQWAHRVTAAEAGEWHVPIWAGNTSAVFIRVPAATWNDPEGTPPAKVKRYFANLYREATS